MHVDCGLSYLALWIISLITLALLYALHSPSPPLPPKGGAILIIIMAYNCPPSHQQLDVCMYACLLVCIDNIVYPLIMISGWPCICIAMCIAMWSTFIAHLIIGTVPQLEVTGLSIIMHVKWSAHLSCYFLSHLGHMMLTAKEISKCSHFKSIKSLF